MHNEPDVRFVDSHAKTDCGKDNFDLISLKLIQGDFPFLFGHLRMEYFTSGTKCSHLLEELFAKGNCLAVNNACLVLVLANDFHNLIA